MTFMHFHALIHVYLYVCWQVLDVKTTAFNHTISKYILIITNYDLVISA